MLRSSVGQCQPTHVFLVALVSESCLSKRPIIWQRFFSVFCKHAWRFLSTLGKIHRKLRAKAKLYKNVLNMISIPLVVIGSYLWLICSIVEVS